MSHGWPTAAVHDGIRQQIRCPVTANTAVARVRLSTTNSFQSDSPSAGPSLEARTHGCRVALSADLYRDCFAGSGKDNTVTGRTRVYRPDQRPDVAVLMPRASPMVIGVWRVGELRMWLQDDGGDWWGQVQYRPDDATRMIDTFPADRIRLL